MSRPRALDLFCGGGGAAMGLYRAGFDIVGVDNRRQPRYPFPYVIGGALWPPMRLEDFDLVWASPPCQGYSATAVLWKNREYPRLIEPIRAILRASERLYVIENVPGAPLCEPVRLCGSSYGLDVRRHRLFECSFYVMTNPCDHHSQVPRFETLGRRGRGRLSRVRGVYGGTNTRGETLSVRQEAVGIPWMRGRELTQAIPPAYSEHIGRYAMMALGRAPEEEKETP